MYANHTSSGNFLIYTDGNRPQGGGTPVKIDTIPLDTPLTRVKISTSRRYYNSRTTYTIVQKARRALSKLGITTYGHLIQVLLQDFDRTWSGVMDAAGWCSISKEQASKVVRWYRTNAPDYGSDDYVVPVILQLDTPIEFIELDPDKFDRDSIDDLPKDVISQIRAHILDIVSQSSEDSLITDAIKKHTKKQLNEVEARAGELREKLAELSA